MRKIVLAAACAAILFTTPGCGALVVGYLVGDAIARDEAVKTCRNNLNNINTGRIAKGEQPFPDQCGR